MQVHSQIVASDIAKTLRVPAHTSISKQAARLYTLMHVLGRHSNLFGLSLQDWISVVHGLDSDVSQEQQAEFLYLKALSVGSRYDFFVIDDMRVFIHIYVYVCTLV